jgi:hypothetical protein
MASTPPAPGLLGPLRQIGGNVTAALVLFGVILTITLPIAAPHGVLFPISAAVSLLSAVVAILLGRLRPLPMGLPGDEARKQAVAAFRTAFFRQFVAIEAPALLALVFSFVLGTAVPYYVSAAIAVVLWLFVGYPSDARVARAERALDAQGGTSELRLALTTPTAAAGSSSK